MKIQFKLVISQMVIISIGFYFLFNLIRKDIRPGYLESVEESMNDTAYILASFIETEIESNKDRININRLTKAFDKAHKKRFSAKRYQVTKTNVHLNIYIVNAEGIVIYDSDNKDNVGKDFSKWKDIVKTFKGEYGARATRIFKDDQSTAVLYVSAPIMYNNKLIGAVTVSKPQRSIQVFLDLAKRKFYLVAILTFAFIVFISIIVSTWIIKPVDKLTNHVNAIRKD